MTSEVSEIDGRLRRDTLALVGIAAIVAVALELETAPWRPLFLIALRPTSIHSYLKARHRRKVREESCWPISD